MDKSSIKISIVASQFNELIVESLIESSIETLEKRGYLSDPEIFKIPGAYELPLAVRNVAEKKKPAYPMIHGKNHSPAALGLVSHPGTVLTIAVRIRHAT